MVETTALEKPQGRNVLEGSNPSLSELEYRLHFCLKLYPAVGGKHFVSALHRYIVRAE